MKKKEKRENKNKKRKEYIYIYIYIYIYELLYLKTNKKREGKNASKVNCKKKGAKIGKSSPNFWAFSYNWVKPFD